jgi:hypothetical protein
MRSETCRTTYIQVASLPLKWLTKTWMEESLGESHWSAMCKVMGSFQPELKDFFAGLVDETAVPHLLDMLAAPHMADGHVHPYSLIDGGDTLVPRPGETDGIDWVTAVGPIVLVVTSDGFTPKKMGYTRMAVRPAMPGFEEIAQRHAFYPMVAMYRGKLCGWFQMLLNLSLI